MNLKRLLLSLTYVGVGFLGEWSAIRLGQAQTPAPALTAKQVTATWTNQAIAVTGTRLYQMKAAGPHAYKACEVAWPGTTCTFWIDVDQGSCFVGTTYVAATASQAEQESPDSVQGCLSPATSLVPPLNVQVAPKP
jgi:hypothetical protein